LEILSGDWRIALREGSHPLELMVEVTTRCNYQCVYCFRNMMLDEDLGDMEPEVFRRVLREAERAGVRKISFSGWGEPLIHPSILDFLGEAKERGFEVLLNTNGFFLADYVDDIYRMGIDELYVSLDSSDEDVYKVLRRGGDLARVVEALLRLKELRRRDLSFKPDLRIQFTLTKLNYENLVPMIGLAGRLAASRLIVSNIIPLTEGMEKSLACYVDDKCRRRVEELKEDVARLSMVHNVYVSMPQLGLNTERRCPFAAGKALFIRRDGLVAPCIYYAHSWRNHLFNVDREIEAVILGDLKNEELIDVWRSRYAEMKFMLDTMHMPSCHDCPLRDYCTLTRSNEADCWGNTPTCAHCPYARDMVRCPL